MSRNNDYRGDTPYADEFCRSFNRMREARRISLGELRDITGISKPYLHHISNGSKGVSLEYAMRIANAFGQPITAMITSQSNDIGAARPTSDGGGNG